MLVTLFSFGRWQTGYAGYVAPRTVFPWLSTSAALVVDMVTAGFACVDAFALFPPFCRQAQDPRHLVTMDKKDSFNGRARRRQFQFMYTAGSALQKTVETPQVQFFGVVMSCPSWCTTGLWSRQRSSLDVLLRRGFFVGPCTSGAGPVAVSTGQVDVAVFQDKNILIRRHP